MRSRSKGNPFGGPEYVLHYLGRYTHRVAISNHRLVSFTDGQVTFCWRDSAHHNEQKLLALSLDEFLRRFLLHILPQGFVRIRHFGFLANRRRPTTLPLCFRLLGSPQESKLEQHSHSAASSLLRSQSALGAKFRRLRSKLGAPKAITAMAHMLARLVYRMLMFGHDYVDRGIEFHETKYRQQQLQWVTKQAAALRMQLVPLTTVTH